MNRLARYILPAAGLLVAMTGVVACSQSECLDNQNALPLAGFYSSSRQPQAISIDSITIEGVGVPGDSILHDSVRNISKSYLPFRIDQGETTYRISYLAGELGKRRVSDLIVFKYDIVPWFVSSACGVSYQYRMTSIAWTDNVIDSVTCPSGIVSNVPGENLRIYFRVNIVEEGGDQ